jgi:DNA relaxase NicK
MSSYVFGRVGSAAAVQCIKCPQVVTFRYGSAPSGFVCDVCSWGTPRRFTIAGAKRAPGGQPGNDLWDAVEKRKAFFDANPAERAAWLHTFGGAATRPTRGHYDSSVPPLTKGGRKRPTLYEVAGLKVPGTIERPTFADYELVSHIPAALDPSCITGPENTTSRQAGTYTGRRVLVDCCDLVLPVGKDGRSPTLGWVVNDILGMPGINFDIMKKGFRNYRLGYSWGKVKIGLDGTSANMGAHITMQGDACRQLEMVLGPDCWATILRRVLCAGGHFTRLDLAIDDLAVPGEKGLIDLEDIIKCKRPAIGYSVQGVLGCTRRPTLIRSPLDRGQDINEWLISNGGREGGGLYLGKRDVMLRIYDKGLQLGSNFHWVRCEIQLRKKKANAAALEILDQSLPYATAGIIRRYCEFVEPCDHKNFARWPVQKWWDAFLGDVPKIRIGGGSPECTLERSLDWASNTVGPTLAMAFLAMDKNLGRMVDWLCGIILHRAENLSARHKAKLQLWMMSIPELRKMPERYIPRGGNLLLVT